MAAHNGRQGAPDLSSFTPESFTAEALRQFRYQYQHVKVYREYVDLLGIDTSSIDHESKIPFLPVELFKNHEVLSDEFEVAELIFCSSGTTGAITSKHYVANASLYKESFLTGFSRFFGNPNDYCILALLPSYLERKESSLVYMAGEMITQSGHPQSGFYLDQLDALVALLLELNSKKQKTLLLGVTFALLDLAAKFPPERAPLTNTIIMETGGMKGRRKEMVRAEVHTLLKNAFGVPSIHSEYGMTELLSQAWSFGEGIFFAPPWMRIVLRESNDPLSVEHRDRAGGLNIIDLANFYSCSFIATQDLGKALRGNTFEILGRFDSSDIRGCNLLVEAQ